MGVDPTVIPQYTGDKDAFAREMQAFAMGVFEEISHEREDSAELHGSEVVPAAVAAEGSAGELVHGEGFAGARHVHPLGVDLITTLLEEAGVVINDGSVEADNLDVVSMQGVAIPLDNWSYVGDFDQGLDSGNDPTFSALHLTSPHVGDDFYFDIGDYDAVSPATKRGVLRYGNAGIVILESGSHGVAYLQFNRTVERPTVIGGAYGVASGLRWNDYSGGPTLYAVDADNLKTDDHLSVAGTLKGDTMTELTGDAGITIEAVLLKDGEVDGIDLGAVDDGVEAITEAEWAQLAEIGTTTISSAQWGYLGAFDQGLAVASSVEFANVTVSAGGNLAIPGYADVEAVLDDYETRIAALEAA